MEQQIKIKVKRRLMVWVPFYTHMIYAEPHMPHHCLYTHRCSSFLSGPCYFTGASHPAYTQPSDEFSSVQTFLQERSMECSEQQENMAHCSKFPLFPFCFFSAGRGTEFKRKVILGSEHFISTQCSTLTDNSHIDVQKYFKRHLFFGSLIVSS